MSAADAIPCGWQSTSSGFMSLKTTRVNAFYFLPSLMLLISKRAGLLKHFPVNFFPQGTCLKRQLNLASTKPLFFWKLRSHFWVIQNCIAKLLSWTSISKKWQSQVQSDTDKLSDLWKKKWHFPNRGLPPDSYKVHR